MKRIKPALAMVCVCVTLIAAWFWWLPYWLDEKITLTLGDQGLVVEQLTWDHIGWQGSALKTLRFRTANNDMQVSITDLALHYQPMVLFNQKLTAIQAHASQVDVQWFQDAYTSPIALASPLPWLTVVPLGLIQIDELHVSQYIEQKIFRRWRGNIKLQQGGMQARLSEAEDPRFHGMEAILTVSQQGDVYASVQKGNVRLASLQGRLYEADDTLRFNATLSMQVHPMLQHFPVVVAGKRLKGEGVALLRVQASASKGLYQTFQDILNHLTMKLNGQFTGALRQARWHAHGNIKAHIGLNKKKGTWRIIAPQLTASGNDWNIDLGTHLLQGGFNLGKGGLHASLDVASFVQWNTLRWQSLVLNKARFQNQTRLHMTWQGRTSPLDMVMTLPSVHWMKQRFFSDSVRLLLPKSNTDGGLHARLSIQGFQWHNATLHLPKADVDLNLQWDKHLQASLRYDYMPQQPWQFDLAWEPDTAKGHINFDIGLNKPEQRLKQLLPATRPMFKKLTLPVGSIRLKGRVSLQAGLWQGRGHALFKGLQGHYAKKTFDGFNADLPLIFNGNTVSLSEGMIRVSSIDVGVPIHNLRISLAANHRIGDSTQLNITRMSFNTLGGQVWGSNIKFDTTKLDHQQGNPFTIRVKNISLVELLALEQQQGVQATGILDGVFPSNLRRAGLFVHKGHLTARPPGGVIRYAADSSMRSMGAKNLGVKLAFQVLDNFQYHQLAADVNYHADGRLLLALHVKGNNPAYDSGRPIEFNVNIEENLKQLFKSLSMADEISDQIEQHVQKKENP